MLHPEDKDLVAAIFLGLLWLYRKMMHLGSRGMVGAALFVAKLASVKLAVLCPPV